MRPAGASTSPPEDAPPRTSDPDLAVYGGRRGSSSLGSDVLVVVHSQTIAAEVARKIAHGLLLGMPCADLGRRPQG